MKQLRAYFGWVFLLVGVSCTAQSVTPVPSPTSQLVRALPSSTATTAAPPASTASALPTLSPEPLPPSDTCTPTLEPLPSLTPTGTPLPPQWGVFALTPGGVSGWQTFGRWATLAYDGYDGCGGAGCVAVRYEPDSGVYAGWWLFGYDDSGWSTQGYVAWHDAWTAYDWHPIPAIGRFVWKADSYWQHGHTYLHRNTFEIPAEYQVIGAQLSVFSDNASAWYINGQYVYEHTVSDYVVQELAPELFRAGANLIAVSIYNDTQAGCGEDCNPFGVQYLLELHYVISSQ